MTAFKVAIVGGSIAGLTLANLLDRLGIDFIVLEAYDKIAPQVGASIGWHPNGLRILDQIGCYEDMRASAAPAETMTARTSDGRVLYSHQLSKWVKERHGYEVLFMERRVALEILFKHLPSKDKVITSRRVIRAEQLVDKVRLYTKDGSQYEADVVIGADGIHSTLRREIWKMAADADPSFVSEVESKAMKTEYGCIFGLSSPTGNLKATEVHLTHKKDVTIACMVGPKNIPYWFLFFKLPQTHGGVDLPRYSREDEIALASQEAETCINSSVKFKQLYDNVSFSTTTALPHHVFSKWHFGRIILIGDSAHKFNPISGQGGNSAIESAAALVDNLAMALRQNNAIIPGKYGTFDDLDKVVSARKFENHDQLMKNFDHIPVLGSSMSYLIAVYFPGTESWDIGFWLMTFYLSISELVVFATWTVESCRARNRAALSRGSIVFGSISNITAIAFGCCFYYLQDNLSASSDNKWWASSMLVPPEKAAAVLPATLLGMLLPTLLMFNIWLPSDLRQYLTIAWMFSPWYLYLLHKYFTRYYSAPSAFKTVSAARTESIAQLRQLYIVLGLITGITHVLTVSYCVLSSDETISLGRIFLLRYFEGMSIYEGDHMMFLWDMYITVASLAVWSILSTWSMSRAGVIHVNMFLVFFVISVGSILIGPAAITSMCCLWRETQNTSNNLKEKEA
ncbi:hypothetical protein G7Z17_g2516 [Cylindrodendrum hubeiense]|uniref:FAD-binding domain-containing protein n=1 Tax=Cylindrodendrum hubeiense TaxID=595255 RepID=A0A9P5HHI4_9HYPO|nr:hypothetical protein G7Z17_g2516 [Cylindrodendrum hubeiense]